MSAEDRLLPDDPPATGGGALSLMGGASKTHLRMAAGLLLGRG